MIPIFRSLISIPAGVTHMNFLRFTLLTTAGAAIWNTILITAGYLLGANWHIAEDYVNLFSKIVLVVCAVALVVWVILRLRSRKQSAEAA